ncbi:hypothetical protein HYU11_02140 [Candidatus Woesearchaeota archaeon]|nr:hypothetical protein [Candidatus Woesearchaeota archaeon]
MDFVQVAIVYAGVNNYPVVPIEDASTGIFSKRPYEVISSQGTEREVIESLTAIINGTLEQLGIFNSKFPGRKPEHLSMAVINSAIAHSNMQYKVEFPLEGYTAWS